MDPRIEETLIHIIDRIEETLTFFDTNRDEVERDKDNFDFAKQAIEDDIKKGFILLEGEENNKKYKKKLNQLKKDLKGY